MTIPTQQLKSIFAAGLILIAASQAISCADGGLTSVTQPSPDSAAPKSDDSKVTPMNVGDETAPVNYSCSCKELIDTSVRAPYTEVTDATSRLQASCTYIKADGNRDMYLTSVVYSGNSTKDFDGAVTRARKGYQQVSAVKSETLEGNISAAFFTAEGSKSRVLSAVVFDPAKGLIVETKEIHLDENAFTLPEHVPATASSALGQAAWVCKKP